MTADRRRALLEATCRMIARTGVRGLRVEEVATEAGTSTALIYYHFGSRAGLLAATMDFVGERAAGYTAARPGLPGRDRLVAQVLGEISDSARVRENSAVWGELRASAVFDPALRPMVRTATARWDAELATLVAEGTADGSIRPGIDAAQAAVRLTALIEGLSDRWLSGLLSTDKARAHLRTALTLECPPPPARKSRQ